MRKSGPNLDFENKNDNEFAKTTGFILSIDCSIKIN